MNSVSFAALMVAWLLGAALGCFFFGGLWWTVQHMASARRPALCLLASGLLRVGLVLPGFYFISNSGLAALLLGLLGFVMARVVVLRITGPAAKGVRHAP